MTPALLDPSFSKHATPGQKRSMKKGWCVFISFELVYGVFLGVSYMDVDRKVSEQTLFDELSDRWLSCEGVTSWSVRKKNCNR